MKKKENNKLFILMTDRCTLNCDFCNFKNLHEKKCIKGTENTPELKQININKGHARESLISLTKGSSVVGLSGGGEPLLNTEGILGIISLSKNKRFVITTSGSFEPSQLSLIISDIDEACNKNTSYCILRLSVDTFHEKSRNYLDNLETLLKWYTENKWKSCKHIFFRTNIIDEKFVYNKFKKICEINKWSFRWEGNDEFVKNIWVNGRLFRLILRPIVNAGTLGIKDKYSIHEYIDILSASDGCNIMIGTPKGCQGCQGCQGQGLPACQNLDGLDITIDTDGNVYLYGGEISTLGSIYDEKLSYEILQQRLKEDSIYKILRTISMKKIFATLSEDLAFKKVIEETNYPYSVIRNLKKNNLTKLKSMLLNIN